MFKNKWVRWVASFLLVATTALVTYWYFAPEDQPDIPGFSDKLAGRTNILVLGVDQRDGDGGRSDTMFVVMYDPKNEQVSLLSVPRDTRVKIPGHGWEKINHSFAFGGYKLAQRTVEELLGIRIKHHIVIDIKGFQRIVDAVGGIDIAVEKRMFYEDPYDNLVIDLQPGMQHMDGRTAIQYVRYRDEEGDIGRIKRQQHFMQAMQEKLSSPAIVTSLPNLIKEVNALMETDMSASEMVTLGRAMQKASKQGLKTDTVPGTPAYIEEVSYWIPDISALRRHIAELQGGGSSERFQTASVRLANEYEKALPKEAEVVKAPDAVKTASKELAGKAEPAKADGQSAAKPAAGNDKPTTAAKPKQVRVYLLNGSGSPAAASRMREILAGRGIAVLASSEVESMRSTLVVSHTPSGDVVAKLSSLPFNYQLQVRNDTGSAYEATVIIGQDFVKK